MKDGAVETVEYMSVDIWCLVNWMIGLCNKTAEMHVRVVKLIIDFLADLTEL